MVKPWQEEIKDRGSVISKGSWAEVMNQKI